MILINCGLGNTAHLFLLRLSWRFLNNFPRMWCVWCQNVNGIKNIVMWDTFSNIIFFCFIYGRLFNENFDTWSFSPHIPRILRASSLSSATMEETNKNQVIWSRVLTKKLLKGTVQNKNREGIYIFVQKPLFKIFEAKWNVVLKILDGMKYQRDSFHQLVVHVSCARGRTRRKSAFHVTLCLAYDEI